MSMMPSPFTSIGMKEPLGLPLRVRLDELLKNEGAPSCQSNVVAGKVRPVPSASVMPAMRLRRVMPSRL